MSLQTETLAFRITKLRLVLEETLQEWPNLIIVLDRLIVLGFCALFVVVLNFDVSEHLTEDVL